MITFYQGTDRNKYHNLDYGFEICRNPVCTDFAMLRYLGMDHIREGQVLDQG